MFTVILPVKSESIRPWHSTWIKSSALEEEGPQRAIARYGGQPEQVVKETVITKELALI